MAWGAGASSRSSRPEGWGLVQSSPLEIAQEIGANGGMLEIPNTEPRCIRAGDTVRWRKALDGYDPATWTLEYLFASAAGVRTVSAVAADGAAGFAVHIAAAETAAWAAGPYTWIARVRKEEDVYTVGEGLCTVQHALAQGVDARSPARRALDVVKEYLANPQSIAASSYTIKGRSLAQYSLPELWQHHDRLVQEVAREEARRSGKGPGGRVLVSFRR